jgi:quercetin dioxygenase-like cupin family protein
MHGPKAVGEEMKRRNLLQMAGVNALAALAASGAAAKVANATFDAQKAKLTKETFGDLKIYFEGPTDHLKSMTAGSLRLKPGMSPHPPHKHAEEEIMLVTEGTGEILVDGTVNQVAPGAMMYCGGEQLHGIMNTGKTPLLFYFYKWQG